jgi:hypothetical protein
VPPPRARLISGFAAAASWCLFSILWFDDGARFRPAFVGGIPSALLLLLLVPAVVWVAKRRDLFGALDRGLLLVTGLAILFRLPLGMQGSAGYTTSDGALSGIVALHIRNGTGHHVFIPSLPYSGSLKSHVAVALSAALDLPRAFTLASILFYGLFVAGAYTLALLVEPALALPAGLYLAFSPAYVTHYSLSNDGNYVEVLAFGTWALACLARHARERGARPALAIVAGVLLGLGLWCHLLGVLYAATAGLVLLAFAGETGLVGPSLRVFLGFLVGFAPGLLWNAGHAWDSFYYIVPGAHPMKSVATGAPLPARALLMATEQWPILLGYDPGYPEPVDGALFALALLQIACVLAALGVVVRGLARRSLWLVPVLFGAVNLVVATVALPHVPENPRYILFLMTPVPILLARLLGRGRGRILLGSFILTGALASLAQAPDKVREDERWRAFAADLSREGIRACYTDFYLASKIDFLTGETVLCCSKLGPTFTEYFDYRARVEAAPEAALIPVNETAAEKVARRLDRLGVTYERLDLMKPVFFRLSRKVDPSELFPEKSFPER